MREQLHWLPMENALSLRFYCLCVIVLPVLFVPGRGFLRSAIQGDLAIPKARTSTVLHKSFAVVGPSFWNRLPSNLCNELLGLPLLLFHKCWKLFFLIMV